jgi:adenosine kinase
VPPFKKALSDLLPYTDYLFGNENEALAFAASEGWETTSIEEIARRIAALPKANGARPRVAVITQGGDETVTVTGDKLEKFPVSCAALRYAALREVGMG